MNDETLDKLEQVSRGAVMLVIVIFVALALYVGFGLGFLLAELTK